MSVGLLTALAITRAAAARADEPSGFSLPSGLPIPSGFTAAATDVPDAFEEGNPFDINLHVGFRRVLRKARLTRENIVDRDTVFADELNYSRVTNVLDLRAEVGLWHDLALGLYLPYVVSEDASWDYRAGVGPSNSTVTTDPISAKPLFEVPYRTYKRGLTSLDVGLSWSPFNHTRDDTKPAWTFRVIYGAPIGAAFVPRRDLDVNDPANGREVTRPAPAGDKVHRLKIEMALSKRFGAAEPYAAIDYVQPFADRAGPSGHQPAVQGGFSTGVELVPWEQPARRQRVAFDLGAKARYIGPARTYSELTDPLRQLTAVDNYASFSLGVHLIFQAAEYVRLTSGVSLGHDTAHVITNETVGADKNGDGIVDLNDKAEKNPLYNDSVDAIGHRFRVEDTTVFTWYVALAVTL